MLSYPTSPERAKYGGSISRRLCGNWTRYAVCWEPSPMKCTGRWLISSNEKRASSSIMAFTRATRLVVALFVISRIALTVVEKAWFPRLNYHASTGNQLVVKERMTSLRNAAQREFLSWVDRESAAERVRFSVWNTFFFFFFEVSVIWPTKNAVK